jgi:phosphohistidine phosphatase
MRLLLIRHGKAGDPKEWSKSGQDDSKRPLTPAGRRRMRDAARGLTRLIPRLDVLATSPLTRASQTAKILYKAYDHHPQFLEADVLSGGHKPAEVIRWIKDHDLDAGGTVALVGHEPDLSRWAAWFLSNREQPNMVEMKKGAVAAIDFPRRLAGGKGTLVGLWTAKALSEISDSK